jgi:putative ABC transport system permease protein
MSFLTLIVKNLFRQRARTGLTILGISIGITTVVALGVIADGLKMTAGEIIRTGDADFLVAQKGAADLSFSSIPEEQWQAVAAVPGVARATGVLIFIKRVGDIPYFATFGIEPEQLAQMPLTVLEGRRLAPGTTNEIMLGYQAANTFGLGIGDTLTIGDRAFTIVGIYQTGTVWQDNGAYAPLSTVQELAGRQGIVTVVYVTVQPGEDPDAVAARIERELPQLVSIRTEEDYGKVDQGMQIIDAANLAISLLAVGIGAIGVMNTMVMSVFERTREIGILRAVGWRGSRIFRLILGESLVLCVVAAVVGTTFGVLLTRAVLLVEEIRGLLEPAYSPDIFIRALVVAVVVALFGAAYPAFRAVRLTPMEALRHE